MPPLLSPVRLSVRLCVCVRGAGPQWPSCGYVLCTVLLSLAVLLAVAVTGAVLFLNHTRVPGTAPPPVVSTGPAGANSALVTVERADRSRLSILIDPRCPDPADGFARLEGAQASVLQALAELRAQPRLAGERERELLDTLADQLPRLLARASELQAECVGLRKGLGVLGQGLGALQSEQGRLIQVRGRVCTRGPGRGPGWLPPCPRLTSAASLHPQGPRELVPPAVRQMSLREGAPSSEATQLEAPGFNPFPAHCPGGPGRLCSTLWHLRVRSSPGLEGLLRRAGAGGAGPSHFPMGSEWRFKVTWLVSGKPSPQLALVAGESCTPCPAPCPPFIAI